MNKYLDALQELKSRVDAYNEYDENANKAFNILKDFIKTVEATETTQMTATEISAAIEFMKKHVEVQAHPDILFYNEQPERVLIDLRYLTDTGNWIKKPKNIEENNRCYNLVKRILDLPEYKENQQYE